MSKRTKFEKFGSIALGAVCVFLAFKLISEMGGSPVEAARGQETAAQPSAHSAQPPKSLSGQIGKLASADPGLEIQALKEYTARPLPENPRDPFDFGAAPAVRALRGAKGMVGGGFGAASTAPAPPQIPLRALGYSFRMGIGGEAYLADGEQVYVVHQGNLISKRYRILQITSAVVEVHDESSGQTVQLPIPEAQ